MTTINSYVTLNEFKAYITASGQEIRTDTADDAVLERLLNNASRYIDQECNQRTFYPRVETRYYSVPEDEELMLDDDLLAITTLTNGDTTTISSTDYNLFPFNYYPKYSIRLKDSVNTYWEYTSDNDYIGAISVLAFWGFHNQYLQRAWKTETTCSAAVATASVTSVSVTSVTGFDVGQIIKIDNELMHVAHVGASTITVVRGENGSTAATHLISSVIYSWQVIPDIWQATIEIAHNAKLRRFGENMTGVATVTPAGMVIGPHDLTETARLTIERYRRAL